MSADFLAHAPPVVQTYYWLGAGAALVLMSTVSKWVWRAFGYMWNQMFVPGVREYPVQWRPPEPPAYPNAEVNRVVGGGEGKVIAS